LNIRKYNFDFNRRAFINKTASSVGTAGILTSLWPEMCRAADANKAYPEELLDIEAYTKGRVKVGDTIDKDSVFLVQDLLDPITFQQILQDGRTFQIQSSENDIEKLFPPYFLDATINNQGQAIFGKDGNVYTKAGNPWIGGLPFPEPKTANEAIANITLSWGRHDKAIYPIPAKTVNPSGEVQFEYDWVWAEQQCSGLVHPSATSPYLKGYEDLLRLQSIWFTHTQDVKGHAFLSKWKYNQKDIPALWGYLPNLKRVRRFPSNQRFEPYMPGMNLNLSDAWASGDPMLTWGNFRIIYRGPFLGSSHSQWHPEHANWMPDLIGGQKNETYFKIGKSLIPEVIVFEGEPVGYPKAPVSKRRIYMDARSMGAGMSITYNRKGEMWKGLEGGSGQLKTDNHAIFASDGRPEWSWNWAMSHDVQKNNVTRFHHGQTCRGGWESALDPEENIVNNYMTKQALRRLGI
jgi:hypothetical protein